MRTFDFDPKDPSSLLKVLREINKPLTPHSYSTRTRPGVFEKASPVTSASNDDSFYVSPQPTKP